MKTATKYICLLLIALLSSCTSYLDVRPVGKILPKTAEDFSVLTHHQLDLLERGWDNGLIGNSATLFERDCYTDDLVPSMATSSYITRFVGFKINNNQREFPSYYSVIKDCNMIIGFMEDEESELAHKLLGASWAMRSISYYNLLINYTQAYDSETADNDLGLSLVDNFDMEAKITRSSISQSIDFIEEGLIKALSYNLTDTDFILTTDVVKGYLARLYFWAEDWDNVIAYAQPLLESYPMLSAEEYEEKINAQFTKASNTLIRSYVIKDDMGALDYSMAHADLGKLPVSKTVVDLFNSEPNDIRTAVAFNKKRIAQKKITSKFRSEELCLMIAEAYAHKKDVTNALKYLNELRSRRITVDYKPLTEATLPEVREQNITVDALGQPLTKLTSAILCERRKELFLEGDRWTELKRNGCPEYWIAIDGRKYVVEKYLYTFPIFKKDVDLYPDIIIQNPGYIY